MQTLVSLYAALVFWPAVVVVELLGSPAGAAVAFVAGGLVAWGVLS